MESDFAGPEVRARVAKPWAWDIRTSLQLTS